MILWRDIYFFFPSISLFFFNIAALTLLSALDLVQNSTDFITNKNLFVFTYGEPRVGDPGFSEYVDSTLKISRVVNGFDPVPQLPPRFLDYEHPSGELWISNPQQNPNNFINCKGPEDPNCSDSVSPFKLNLSFHDGPYFGVSMAACSSDNQITLQQLEIGLGYDKL